MKKLQLEERAQLVEDIVKRNAAGLDPIGASIRRLRLEVTGLDQETFAAMCKMSTKSLYELESGKSNPKLSTLDAVLRLFGVRMGMVMTAKDKPLQRSSATMLASCRRVGQSLWPRRWLVPTWWPDRKEGKALQQSKRRRQCRGRHRNGHGKAVRKSEIDVGCK